jgi:hypothetical protein
MTFKQRVDKQLGLRANSEELLALWEKVWTAYSNGGTRYLEIALDELREEVANDKENKCNAGV